MQTIVSGRIFEKSSRFSAVDKSVTVDHYFNVVSKTNEAVYLVDIVTSTFQVKESSLGKRGRFSSACLSNADRLKTKYI